MSIYYPDADCLEQDVPDINEPITNLKALDPLVFDNVNNILSVNNCGPASSGVLTSQLQSIGGNKNFIDGFAINSGTQITEISIDGLFSTSSDNKLVTQKGIKSYVDNKIFGITSWQQSVKDFWDASGGLPSGAVEGDRLICSVAGNGWIKNNIYTYLSSSWFGIIPSEGWSCYVDDEDSTYTFNGTGWVHIGVTINHLDLLNIGTLTHSQIDDKFLSTTESTNISTGALTTVGGVGISKNLNIGGITKLWNTTDATNSITGSLQVSGGCGISKNLHVGDSINIENNLKIGSDISQNRHIEIASNTTYGYVWGSGAPWFTTTNLSNNYYNNGSTDIITEPLLMSSNISCAPGNINFYVNGVANDLPLTNVAYFDLASSTFYNNLIVFNTTDSTDLATGSLKVAGGTAIYKNLNVGGITKLWNTTESTSISTGALQVSGGCGISKNLFVGGITSINTTNQLKLAYDNSNYTTINTDSIGDLTVNASGNDIYLHSTDAVHVSNTTGSTSTSTGALQVSGGCSIAKQLNVGAIRGPQLSYTGTTLTNEWFRVIIPSASYYAMVHCDNFPYGKIRFMIRADGGGSSISKQIEFNPGSSFNARMVIYRENTSLLYHIYVVANGSYNLNIWFEHTTAYLSQWAWDGTDCGPTSSDPTDLPAGDFTLLRDSENYTNVYASASIGSLSLNYQSTQQLTLNYGSGAYTTLNTDVNGDLTVNATGNDINFHSTDKVSVLNTTVSTSTSTGSLIVSGGIGVTDGVYCTRVMSTGVYPQLSLARPNNALPCYIGVDGSGNMLFNANNDIYFDATDMIYINNTTESTSTQTGSLQLAGGCGIAKNLYVGGNLNVNGIINPSIISLNGTTESTSTDTGSLIIAGGTGIAKNLNVGGISKLWNTTESTDSLTGSLQIAGGCGISKNVNIGGVCTLYNTTSSTSTSTGSLVISGGLGIGERIIYSDLYKELQLFGNSRLGASSPSFLEVNSSGVYTYKMDVGNKLYFNFELTHDYKYNTSPYFHCHVCTSGTSTDQVSFQFEYCVAKLTSPDIISSGNIKKFSGGENAPGVAYQVFIIDMNTTEMGKTWPSNVSHSSVISGVLTRNSGNTDDVYIFDFAMHYKSDRIGTLTITGT